MKRSAHITTFAAVFGCVAVAHAGTTVSLVNESPANELLEDVLEAPQSPLGLTPSTGIPTGPQASQNIGVPALPVNQASSSSPQFNDDVIELSGEAYAGLNSIFGGSSDSREENFAETDVLRHTQYVFVRNTVDIDEVMGGPAIPLPTPVGLAVVGVLALAAPRRRGA